MCARIATPDGAVAAVVLAAGRARRFDAADDDSKVVAVLAGVPLVRRVALAALASNAAPVLVVTGHAADAVVMALGSLPVAIVHNLDYARGIATSLRSGLAALPPQVAGALILLADMPLVTRETMNRLVACFEREGGAVDAIVPVFEGRRGNPVLLGRRMFGALEGLDGDDGARKLLGMPGRTIVLCEVDDPGVEIDIDTRDALEAIRGA